MCCGSVITRIVNIQQCCIVMHCVDKKNLSMHHGEDEPYLGLIKHASSALLCCHLIADVPLRFLSFFAEYGYSMHIAEYLIITTDGYTFVLFFIWSQVVAKGIIAVCTQSSCNETSIISSYYCLSRGLCNLHNIVN